jgi:autotransporter-associated beta strand protein
VLDLGAGVTTNTILFDTSSAAAYTIGSGAVGSQSLTLNDGGAITVNSTVTNNQLFNAAITLGTARSTVSTITFTNNSASALLTIAGSITPTTGGTGSAATKTLALTGSGNGVISGVISGNGSGGNPTVAITKTGAGAWTLSGPNTYSGTTTVSAGSLNIGNNSALGTGTLSLSGGTIAATGGSRTIVNAITLAATSTIAGSNSLTLNGALTQTLSSTLTVNNSATTTFGGINLSDGNTPRTLTILGSGNITFGGVIGNGGTGAGTLTFDSGYTGTATLNGTNTYSGTTNIIRGTVAIGNDSAFGTSAVSLGGTNANTPTIFASGGARTISNNLTLLQTSGGGNPTITGSNDLTLNGTLTNSGANRTLTINNTAITTQAGDVFLSETSGTGRTLTINGSGNLTISGVIANFNGAGTAGNLAYGGSGTLTLTGNNTYTGTTTISSGTLQIGNGGTSGTLGAGAVTNNAALSFNRSDALSVSNLISGSGSVTKAGSGTTTLTANNTYTGATNVNAGKLLINGDQSAASGAVTVTNSGSVLGGTGTIGSAVTVNSGAAILGGTGTSASGTLSVSSSLTLNSGSIIELALGPSLTHSTLARTGSGGMRTWTFQSNQQFTFIDVGATTGTYQNIITGLASNTTVSGWTINNPGMTGSFSFDGNNVDLNLTAVPEPGTWAAASLALIALLIHQRRRIKRSIKH